MKRIFVGLLLGCAPDPSAFLDLPFERLACASGCDASLCVRLACNDLPEGAVEAGLRNGPPVPEAWQFWLRYRTVATTAGYVQLVDAWQRCPERIRRVGEGPAADWVLDFHLSDPARYGIWSLYDRAFHLYRGSNVEIQQGIPAESMPTASELAFMRAAAEIDVCVD